ncbi:hypothetical protein [Streptomyces sp. NBC_01618]|uniref:hypothetical protein n=1 Tax=Streptomyces sp. NBC_01618 TaxID=2975900 RepID=UPI00386D6A9E
MKDFFAQVETRMHTWPPFRKDLHWLVIPGEDVARKYLYEPYRTLVEQPGVCPVRPEWMHVTVLHAGPQDSATGAEIDQLIAEVAKRAVDIAPYTLTLSPATASGRVRGRPTGPRTLMPARTAVNWGLSADCPGVRTKDSGRQRRSAER